jgi:hypothetical protein
MTFTKVPRRRSGTPDPTNNKPGPKRKKAPKKRPALKAPRKAEPSPLRSNRPHPLLVTWLYNGKWWAKDITDMSVVNRCFRGARLGTVIVNVPGGMTYSELLPFMDVIRGTTDNLHVAGPQPERQT